VYHIVRNLLMTTPINQRRGGQKRTFRNIDRSYHKFNQRRIFLPHHYRTMKLSTITLLSAVGSASAFVPRATTNAASRAVVGELKESVVEPTDFEPVEPVPPVMSKSLPWMEVSKALDGSLPGDVSTHCLPSGGDTGR
jgi:hypothetical protein